MVWGNSGKTPAEVAGDRRTATELAGNNRNFRPTHLLDRKAPKPSTGAKQQGKPEKLNDDQRKERPAPPGDPKSTGPQTLGLRESLPFASPVVPFLSGGFLFFLSLDLCADGGLGCPWVEDLGLAAVSVAASEISVDFLVADDFSGHKIPVGVSPSALFSHIKG
ncbi:hypothetical protein Cgig2_012605 [Carnegiea gigantea]|uniref:Uncharacterized protein n=1 Tax=Carnegiea gigantea TaxID=171969 RepID=A0A9Q1GRE1_9CARY|nr:hypothetical protein Cgig2_012605 [Carnegiea gigantea]